MFQFLLFFRLLCFPFLSTPTGSRKPPCSSVPRRFGDSRNDFLVYNPCAGMSELMGWDMLGWQK